MQDIGRVVYDMIVRDARKTSRKMCVEVKLFWHANPRVPCHNTTISASHNGYFQCDHAFRTNSSSACPRHVKAKSYDTIVEILVNTMLNMQAMHTRRIITVMYDDDETKVQVYKLDTSPETLPNRSYDMNAECKLFRADLHAAGKIAFDIVSMERARETR